MSTEEEDIFLGELTDLPLKRSRTWQTGEFADRRVEEADTWPALAFLVYELGRAKFVWILAVDPVLFR